MTDDRPGPDEPDDFAWLYGDSPRPQPEIRRSSAEAAPRTQAPRPQAPRPQTPRPQAPRPQAPRPQALRPQPPRQRPLPPRPVDQGPYRSARPGPRPVRPAGPGATAVMPAVAPRPADRLPTDRPPTRTPPTRTPPTSTPPTGTQPRPGRRRPHRLRRALIGLVVVVVLLVGGIVGLGEYAWGKVGRIQAFPTTRVAAGAGTTYLLIGSDSRAGLTRAQQDALGTGSDAGARTDSIMIVDVPSDGSKPAIISIPRDSYVAIPGHGHNKINAAFAFGGAPLLVQTIETDTGLHVDHVVEIGFGGFAGLVDDLDGVRICSKTAVDDADAHIDIKAGCQVMNGKTALGYVRARHFDPLGDLGRVQRQRQVLAAIVAKATSTQTLLHPGRLWSLVSDGGATLSVDDQMHSWDALKLARAVRDVSAGEGVTTTVPIADPNATTSAGSSVLWNDAQAATLFRALQAGHGVPAALVSGSGLGAS